MIDRIGPTIRPVARVVGRQRWRSLLFLHWPVPVAALRPLVPAELTLDLHEDVAYVGVVPFAMEGVRPAWCPEMFALSFLETNVRTYVLHNGRPGVFFFSLEASSRLAVWAARRSWSLPYYFARMETHPTGDVIDYSSQRRPGGPRFQVRYRLGEVLGPSQPGTLEHFLLERYLLFVQHGGRMLTGQVHHTPYPAQKAEILEVHDELIAAAGLAPVTDPPRFAHYFPGVDVEIFGPH